MRHHLIVVSMLLAAWLLLPQGTAYGGDVFQGKKLYKSYCESCHGPKGRGRMPGAPNFTRGQGLVGADTTLFETIRSGKQAMPGFRGVLDDHQILDVISYIRTFF